MNYEIRYLGQHSPETLQCTACRCLIAPCDPYLRVEVVPLAAPIGGGLVPVQRAPLLAGRACRPECAKIVAKKVPEALSKLPDGFATYPPNGGRMGVAAC